MLIVEGSSGTLKSLYSAPLWSLQTHGMCGRRGTEVGLVTIDSQALRPIDNFSRRYKHLGDGVPRSSRGTR